MQGLPVHHQLPEFAQTPVHWVGDAIPPPHPLSSPSPPCLQSFPASGSFPISQFLASGSQSIRVSASSSVLPMKIQDWFPLGLIGLISEPSQKGIVIRPMIQMRKLRPRVSILELDTTGRLNNKNPVSQIRKQWNDSSRQYSPKAYHFNHCTICQSSL